VKRLLSFMRLDCLLQRRYKFYHAALFMTLIWIVVLRTLRPEILPTAVPFIVFVDLAVVGFYFIAGSLLFEKGERTLRALLTSPLRFGEFLTARLATLTLLAAGVSFAVALASYGPHFNAALFAAGVILNAVITLLVGIFAVAPYDSISRFLIPSQLYVIVLYLPLIPFFGWWRSPVFYLVPTHGSLLLLTGAFDSIPSWQIFYAVAYQILWLFPLTVMVRRRFQRHLAGRGEPS
jgi:fluoroquinolone transport system permease protein